MTTLAQAMGVAVLGGLAALARVRLAAVVSRRLGGHLHLGTLAVNCLAAFAAGLLAGLAPSEGWRVLLAVGVLGSFSTFSTWMLETRELAGEGGPWTAALNVVVPAAAGLALAVAGWAVGAAL